MNRNVIKFIAAFTMLLDHIGEIFFVYGSTTYLILRILGRIAFVLFAYMIAEGFFKTTNLKRYLLRLLSYAVIIEFSLLIIYFATNINLLWHYNVVWPLVFGLLGLILLKQDSVFIRLLVVPLVIGAELINTAYGGYGPLLIMIFAIYQNVVTQFLFLVGINLIFIDIPLMNYAGLSEYARYSGEYTWIQWFSLLGFIFIMFYNQKKGKLNTKWFFYVFYPAHLVILYLISIYI